MFIRKVVFTNDQLKLLCKANEDKSHTKEKINSQFMLSFLHSKLTKISTEFI